MWFIARYHSLHSGLCIQTANSLKPQGFIKCDLSCTAKHLILTSSPPFPNVMANRETAVFGVSLPTASISSDENELSTCEAR